MTKYVVNSGNIRGDMSKAKKYFAEVFKGLGNNPKVLFCFFANLREEWEESYQNYVNDFGSYLSPTVKPSFQLAMPADFIKQCKDADVIWIKGGDDHLVQYWLSQYKLRDVWRDKVVAVSSASSDAVATHFWTGDWRECFDGLGLIPMKFIAHYKSSYGDTDPRGPIDWERGYKELEDFGDKMLPIYALPEGDFKVFEI